MLTKLEPSSWGWKNTGTPSLQGIEIWRAHAQSNKGEDLNGQRWPEEAAPHAGLVCMIADQKPEDSSAINHLTLQDAG